MIEHVVVPAERAGLELDEFLCLLFPECSKGWLRQQVRAGQVLLDGQPAVPGKRLRSSQVVSTEFDPEEAPKAPTAATDPIVVLFEDADVVAFDKAPGIAVEPERWFPDRPTVAASLLAWAQARGGDMRPRLAHRLDKDTSGVMLAAKHLEAERALRVAFEERRVEKAYIALVEGEFPDEALSITKPLGPDRRQSGRMVVASSGKPAVTEVRLVRPFRGYSLVEARPRTGRTHQIRVHLASEGFPLAVDPLYGRRTALRLSELKAGYRAKKGREERPLIDRLTLHAERLSLGADVLGHPIEVEAPLPKDFERVAKQLSKVRGWR
ncbi:MAG: RluA family pseudouridine synthase [Planctomycetota bacterium]